MALRHTVRRTLPRGALLLSFAGALTGCHSAFVSATVRNETGATVSPVEVDYPSASFGVPSLSAGATYSYRFKILGNGTSKVVWTDSMQHDHTVAGPAMHEGQEGGLQIVLRPDSATWTPTLQDKR